ncbi:MCE family protein [Mycobacterium sp. 236(2023)]|uniref:MCE family protein n=1 Tax=Mycobacterium sp. 236(2023) TaxID=3038163 RepID=UPI002415848A|nr:MCE family protein [Mycobacterium sp. 236(2023)]MDG4668064.1 MCE family protein [Mycobacterium sp. 236(2023)]
MRTEVIAYLRRHTTKVGIIGICVIAGLVALALNASKLPLINPSTTYTAYLSEASGLTAGIEVQVAGLTVGQVKEVALDGQKVLVTFEVGDDVFLGDRSEAAVKTKALLGTKVLEITVRGDAPLAAPIPLDRTRPAYQLADALGDLSSTIDDLQTDELNASLTTLADAFAETPPQVRQAVEGVARFSEMLNDRDAQLRELLANANKATTVLADRSGQIVELVHNSNALLASLRAQSGALDNISRNVSAVAQQLSGFIDDNKAQLRPALEKLNGVLTIIDNRKERIQKSIKLLNSYAMSLGESVSSGPFFKAYLSNLLPGQFLQPFVDAAFSDLGLDPNVLLPSERIDPPTGQPGTPALPVPYPRTGQGGPPRLTLPDAITGNPGDEGCGPPGVPLPGPTGCYPYREPPPAPAPGGPPPGPPAPAAPHLASTPEPTPLPVYVPAPGEAPPAGGRTQSTPGGQP